MPALILVLLNGIIGWLAVRKAAVVALAATFGVFITGLVSQTDDLITGYMNSLSPQLYAFLDILGVPVILTAWIWALSTVFFIWAFRIVSFSKK